MGSRLLLESVLHPKEDVKKRVNCVLVVRNARGKSLQTVAMQTSSEPDTRSDNDFFFAPRLLGQRVTCGSVVHHFGCARLLEKSMFP